MKYHLFHAMDYDPAGGIGDYKGSFADVEEAKAAARKLLEGLYSPHWAELIESTERGLVKVWSARVERGKCQEWDGDAS